MSAAAHPCLDCGRTRARDQICERVLRRCIGDDVTIRCGRRCQRCASRLMRQGFVQHLEIIPAACAA